MSAVPSLADAPYLDFFDPELQTDPEPLYAALRASTAVVRTPIGASVIRREEVRSLLADPRLVTSIPHLVRLQGVDDGWLFDMLSSSVISTEGPDHTRLRRLVSRSFTPAAATRHRPTMQALVHELVDAFVDAGRCDFVADFADHYPVQVICEVLGAPREDHDQFARWGNALTYVLSLELGDHLAEVEEAADGSRGVRRARWSRTGARIPATTSSPASYRHRRTATGCSGLELFSMISGLVFAGYDTTRNQLGQAVFAFARHPEQWALLGERPELAPQAVDEVMRLVGAVSGVPRIALEDVDVDGWTIPAGTRRVPVGRVGEPRRARVRRPARVRHHGRRGRAS